ncbi:MAG: RsmD family RNA methyltransferase, partial [Gammaproteobacteria bacterium]
FSYVGGWGLQCLAAGASELFAVDASESALDQLQANAQLQGVEEQVTTLEGNAFDVLEALLSDQQKFDVVIVDPPAFIKRRKDYNNGLSAYNKLNTLAIRLLQPNGLLLSGSCSMHLPEADLEDLVRGAARHVDRHAQLVFRGGQGPDHPVHPAIAETRYLKALLYRISPAL